MAKKNKRKVFKPSPGHKVLPALDLGFLNARAVTIPDWSNLQIVLAGAGGTGAYMAQHLGRMMVALYQMDKGIHFTIVDPDVVTEQNIGRQLFCKAEEGMPKAECLARRYGHAWGLNTSSFVGKFDDSLLLGTELTLIVGCVDNAEARRAIAQTLEHDKEIWWLDCGNLSDTGRVLFGSAFEYEDLRGAFSEEGKCTALPSPAMQDPGLLVAGPDELEDSDMSCAELARANLQSLNINARVAAEAADFATRFLVTRDLKRFACDINLEAGAARSSYVTAEEVARVTRKPASFLESKPSIEDRLILEQMAEEAFA